MDVECGAQPSITIYAGTLHLNRASEILRRLPHTVGRTIFDWRYYLAVLQRKPGAQRNDAPHALRLVIEPQANVNRYDELREQRTVCHA